MSRDDTEFTYNGPSWDTLSRNARTDQSLRFTRISNGKRIVMAADQVDDFSRNGFRVVCINNRDDYVTLEGYAERRSQPAKYVVIARS